MTARIDSLETRLIRAVEAVERTRKELSAAKLRAAGHTPDDMAAVSGTRRKASPRADRNRLSSYARESLAFDRYADALAERDRLERVLAAARVEASRPRFTRDDLLGAVAVRDRHGWHLVIRVNPTSVTVATGYSWTDRIAHDRVLEVRK